MSEETTSIDYVMEASSRSHFSALRLDGQVPSSATAASSTLDSTLTLNSLPNQPFVIGVSGGTASGKTTVGNMIIQQLHDHCVVLVNKDLFYHGLNPEELKRVHKYNFNHPGVDVILDCMGATYYQKNLDSLNFDGRLFIIGFQGKHTSAGDKEKMVPLAEVQAQTDQTQAKGVQGVQTTTNKRRMVRPAYLIDFI
ncbi:uridine kinase-like protein 1, chloroplastic [Glycine soja]|uniref:uridine kinase-like protein 1, chloroplastic n=1 Tax=Glycine soja TaxID=3848 RepID=UPI00103A9479|nr:uridine kinase-like protein 1, chloroplastic [Glycine soja]